MIDKKKLVAAIIGCVLCLSLIGCIAIGFFIGKRVYDTPISNEIKRDTVTLWDTIPHWYPAPVEAKPQKPVYKWLTKVEHSTDTLTLHDSVLVEVPITSKHYKSKQYDAWVSGFEPSLDSIKVYQRTEYITERVTLSKPPNKWELDAVAGLDYNIMSKKFTPYAGGELIYKPNRLQVGIRGGVAKTEKAEPFAGAVVKIRLF